MIGILVLGQSPRPQLEKEFRRILRPDIEIRLTGILDGMSSAERAGICAASDDDALFAVLPDNTDVRLSHKAVAKLAPAKLQALSDAGCNIVLFCCTGEFPELAARPFLLPSRILTYAVRAACAPGRLGVFAPLPEQIDTMNRRWRMAGFNDVAVIPLPPNAAEPEIEEAAARMAQAAPDHVVYDCMSYGHALRQQADTIVGRSAIMSNSIVARFIAELAGC